MAQPPATKDAVRQKGQDSAQATSVAAKVCVSSQLAFWEQVTHLFPSGRQIVQKDKERARGCQISRHILTSWIPFQCRERDMVGLFNSLAGKRAGKSAGR